MKIDLDSDMVKEVVSAAIFQSFDEQKRDSLIKSALDYLLKPGSESYNRGKTPLQSAFELALNQQALAVAESLLKDNVEVKAKLESMMLDALVNITTTRRQAIVDKMSDALLKALTNERY